MFYLWMFILGLISSSMYGAEQKLIIIRHGEALNNIEKTYNSNPDHPNYKEAPLTEEGIKSVQAVAKTLRKQGFDKRNIVAIFVSPLPRTTQTAEILVQQGLISRSKIIVDKRLIETQAGDLEGKPYFPVWKPSFALSYQAETEEQVKDRVQQLYRAILEQHPKGNILIVTHAMPAENLIAISENTNAKLNPGEVKIVSIKKEERKYRE